MLWKSSWKIIYQKLSESVSKWTLTGPQRKQQLLAWAWLVSRLLCLTFFLHLREPKAKVMAELERWFKREGGPADSSHFTSFFSLNRRSYSLCGVFFRTQPCNMMFGASIEGRRGLRFEALRLFHQWFIPSASKESESKSKMHNWIYITHLDEIFIFWLLIKNPGLLQDVSAVICARFVLDTASSSFGGCMIRLLPGVPVDGVAGLLDPPQTLRSITLLCTSPFIKPH